MLGGECDSLTVYAGFVSTLINTRALLGGKATR
jgi:hypothetical protein